MLQTWGEGSHGASGLPSDVPLFPCGVSTGVSFVYSLRTCDSKAHVAQLCSQYCLGAPLGSCPGRWPCRGPVWAEAVAPPSPLPVSSSSGLGHQQTAGLSGVFWRWRQIRAAPGMSPAGDFSCDRWSQCRPLSQGQSRAPCNLGTSRGRWSAQSTQVCSSGCFTSGRPASVPGSSVASARPSCPHQSRGACVLGSIPP